MGMVSRSMANFLYAAVRGRRSILVIGVPGAGKTTLLRALAQCVERYERFASLETEYELFLHKIFDTDKSGVTKPRYPLLVPMEARPGTGETGPNGRPAGEMSVADLFPASLRHSLQRLLIGEMRGAEIVPTLMAMARGYRGSMASFHANSVGHALIDRALYLPRSWVDDPARCAAAGIPTDVGFATKPALAPRMIGAALDAGVGASWVTGDEVYGNDPALRAGLQDRRIGYVLAVSCDHRIPTNCGPVRADSVARGLPPVSWQRLSAGAGSKGQRMYSWAYLSLPGRVG